MDRYTEQSADLRGLVESHGGKQKGGRVIAEAVLKDLNEQVSGKHDLDAHANFMSRQGIPELFEAFVGPKSMLDDPDAGRWAEAVNSSQFPNLTGTLLGRTFIRAYKQIPTIWQDLVEVVPSKHRSETIAGIDETHNVQVIKEGREPERTDVTEKTMTATNILRGTALAITRQSVFFDTTGQLVKRTKFAARDMVHDKEKRIVQGVSGISATVYNGGIMYENDQSNILSASATPTQAEFEALVDLSRTHLNDKTDEGGNQIMVPQPWTLLVPSEREKQAWVLGNTIQSTGTGNNDMNFYKGKYQVRTSPFLTNAKDFWLGNFKAQYQWNEVWALETIRTPADPLKGILGTFFAQEFGEVMATDFKYVVMHDVA
jgi:hypothetical protein